MAKKPSRFLVLFFLLQYFCGRSLSFIAFMGKMCSCERCDVFFQLRKYVFCLTCKSLVSIWSRFAFLYSYLFLVFGSTVKYPRKEHHPKRCRLERRYGSSKTWEWLAICFPGGIPSLKLTASLHLEMDDWNANVLFGMAYFQELYVSFRECTPK